MLAGIQAAWTDAMYGAFYGNASTDPGSPSSLQHELLSMLHT